MSVQLRIDACSKYDHCKVCTSSKKNKRHQSNSVPGCPDAERFKCKFCSGDAALRHCTLLCLRKAAGGGQSSNLTLGAVVAAAADAELVMLEEAEDVRNSEI